MGLFYRRRLCLFCFLFAISALVAWLLPVKVLLLLGIVCGGGLGILCLLFFLIRSHPRRLLTLLLCLFCVGAALLQTYVRVELPQKRVDAYVGERPVVAHIVDVTYRSEHQGEYVVNLLQVQEEDTHVRARLFCEFSEDLQVGDTVYATGEVTVCERDSEGCLLSVLVETADGVSVRRTSLADCWDTLRSDSGLWILSVRARSAVQERLSSLLGDGIGALASAFLLGDRSALTAEVERDFRRAGVSHMMAVSGMHISVLLGSIEWLLRRLFMPKKLRCLTVAFLGVVFLFLTGFSLSACRSVLMLFFVYLFFYLQEGNDSLTALFSSVVLILLISPRAVTDLGMWMSFLATLGLLTVYPLCEARIRFSRKKGFLGWSLRFLRRCALLVIMTVVANLFLLPLIWIFFGEISLIALLSNVLLAPVSFLFLLGIPFVLILSVIPLMGTALGWLLAGLGEGMLWLVRSFSRLPFATVSLNYDFCDVLIPLFTVAMIILLLVRLKRKRWLLLPPALLLIAFVVCLAVVKVSDRGAVLEYEIDAKRNETVILTEGDRLAICDVSCGSRSVYGALWERCRESTATEIEALLLTHYHGEHRAGLDLLMRQAVIRTLYLPTPWDGESYAAAQEICRLAERLDTAVVFYRTGQTVRLTDSITVQAEFQPQSDTHDGVALRLSGENSSVAYWSAEWIPEDRGDGASDYLILGSHGTLPKERPAPFFEDSDLPRTVIYTSRSLPRYAELSEGDRHVYIPRKGQTSFTLTLPLS